ncbi:hypothetical protein C0991_008590 [Blastosporella zonata]|nr:hypothetical protein C0991_008590 [Blastosporella zonata]
MPARGHNTAPSFSPNEPRELPRYFQELEFLFASSGVTDDADTKALGICYVDYNTSEQWLLLAEYEASGIDPTTQTVIPYSYQDWKTAVISLYPGGDNATKYSMANLDQVTGEAGRANIKTIGQFAAYYRKFYQITKWLVDSSRLGSLERDRLFRTGLSNKLWITMQHCLNIVERDIRPGDPYTMAQMKAAAKFVLHGTNTTILNTAYTPQAPGMFIRRDNQPFGSSLSLPSRHISVTPPVPEIKKEEYKQRIAEMDTKLEAVLASLQKLTSGNNNSLGRGKCAFCGRMGHTVHNCYEVEQYINSGRVLRHNNRLCLPSGPTLPNPTMPGLTLQNRFNDYHQVNPGQKGATTNLSGNMCPDEEQWSGIQDMANSMLYGISDADHSTMALQTNTSATA